MHNVRGWAGGGGEKKRGVRLRGGGYFTIKYINMLSFILDLREVG